ncbi:hypothetical protein [Nocardioides daejeonensis]|uniref:hypothetical protein n=1 Tax=Nocardioides daejeonensis TaxID=1046556 RepID=UPI0019512379|nr:hypothetical protein [Nocardioides daejeonensis]
MPVAHGSGLVEAWRALAPITASADAVGGRDSVAATQAVLVSSGRAVTAWRRALPRAAATGSSLGPMN